MTNSTEIPATMDGYIRVSRVMGRGGEGYISPTVQREAIERWAQYKGITIAKWHVDEDQSGGTQNRPGLRDAVDRALAGETGGIVAWKIDRFSRTTEGGLRDLHRLRDAQARLAFVAEDIDTTGVMGRMIYTIMLATSEAFLESIKLSWIDAKTRATNRGAQIGPTPLGYARGEGGVLVEDEYWTPIVRQLFEMAASGQISESVVWFNATTGRNWTVSQIRRLLASDIYLGRARYGNIIAEAEQTHPALVSRSLWTAAQTTPTRRRPAGDYPLSQILTCGSCGAPMVGARAGQMKRTYRCSAGLSTTRREKCPAPPTIMADTVEMYLRNEMYEAFEELEISIGEDADLSTYERAMVETEAELDAYIEDLNMRRRLGPARYQRGFDARADAADEARRVYAEKAKEAHGTRRMVTREMLDDPTRFGESVASLWSSVTVVRGKGRSVGQRVTLVPIEADDLTGELSSQSP